MSEDTRRSRDKQDEELGDTQRESIKQSLANTPLTPAGANEGLELKEIETAKIVYGPFQYRDSSSNLAKVRESIGQHGLIEPVLVRPLPNGVFEIVCGHTRLQAHKDLGIPKIKAIVRIVSDDQASTLAFIDNHERHQQTWQDEARYFTKRLKEASISERELARQLGGEFSYRYIQERIQRFKQLHDRGLQDARVSLSKVPDLLGLKDPRVNSKPELDRESYLWPVRMPLDLHERLQKLSRDKAEEAVVAATRLYFEHEGQSGRDVGEAA